MKLLSLALAALILLIQYPLWLGKGSWLRVWEVDRQIRSQREVNRQLQARNQLLLYVDYRIRGNKPLANHVMFISVKAQ